MRPFCSDCSIETIRSKANKVFLVANVMSSFNVRVVPLEEKRHDPIREKDEGKKRQMKAYADGCRHA